ncbi:DUF4394 domain-containing protein [Limnobacter sp.]|uniref:DUF4394 domain-containing protein n=1 Tax=Limnobacter sp. TaxID=2003368 RepID=UPI0027BA9F11|nr:DUF4394 domain-containing protein [Limnobacter sp.]
MKFKKKFVALALSSLVLGGCFSDDNTVLSAGDVFVLTSNGQLATFNRDQPSVIRTSVAVSGLMAGDTLLGMDFRPRDGQLYAIARTTTPANGGRLYTINTTTGVATAGAILTATLNPAATSFAVDFNPMADALRVIADTGENLRIFVVDAPGMPARTAGQTTVDGPISDLDADISGAAYTNSFDGTTSTRLLNIDTDADNLTFQNPPNDGTQVVVASLGVDAEGTAGFDIDSRNNVGYALLNVDDNVSFYRIAIPDSTATLPLQPTPPSMTPPTVATLIGNLNVSGIIGMALVQPAAPQAIALDGATGGAQRLLKFGIRTPNQVTAVSVSGLAMNESLLSIDYRPANSTLYGLSSSGRIFKINPDTGAATVASTVTIAAVNPITTGITDGRSYAIDFNPMANALRVVSTAIDSTPDDPMDNLEDSENLRVPPTVVDGGGESIRDIPLAFATAPTPADFNIGQVAYTNSFANPLPSSTRLFDIDTRNNRLLQQTNANGGVLALIGNFSTTFNQYGGFDISGGDNGMVLMANRPNPVVPDINVQPFSLFSSALVAGPAPATTVAVTPITPASGTAVIGSGMTQATDIRALTIKF